MMGGARLVTLLASAWLALASPALSDEDPAAWVERCMSYGGTQPDLGSWKELCQTTILMYCTFSAHSTACFESVTQDLHARSDEIVRNLPSDIEDVEPQTSFYAKRLANARDGYPDYECDPDFPDGCEAERALVRYFTAQALVVWLEVLEQVK